jgi:hypothetical protein
MKRTLSLLLGAFALASCGGSGSSFHPTPEQQALADCTGLDLGHLGQVYGEVLALFETIPGAPTGGTYDILNGNYTLTTTIGGVAGVVSSSDVIDDGIDVGESATATWALNGGLAGTTVTGDGVFTIARPSTVLFNVSGNGGILDGTCEFTFTNLSFSVSATGGLTGTILFTADAPQGTLTGTMTFNGTNTARVAATMDSVDFVFYIDLVTLTVTF